MADWKRSTRDCAVSALPAETRAALDKYIELYNLGDLLSNVVACVETTSEKVKKGLFGGGAKPVVTTMLLMSGWLMWTIRAEGPQVTVISARLADITVQDYAKTPFAKMVPDSGVEVTGAFTDVAERGSAFLGLDYGSAALRFKEQLMKAVQDAK